MRVDFDFFREFAGIAAFIVVVVLPVGYILYPSYMPHLLLNETSRYLYQYREITRRDDVNLIPGLFQGGEPRHQVEQQLLEAGLEAWGTNSGELPPGTETRQGFRLRAGRLDIACGSELFVLAGYDGKEQLTSATVRQGGACL